MQSTYNGLALPPNGQPIDYQDGQYLGPDNPIVPYIVGDGTGRDLWKAAQRVFDAAVEKAKAATPLVYATTAAGEDAGWVLVGAASANSTTG